MNNIQQIKSVDIKQLISKETGLSFKKDTLKQCPFCKSGAGSNGSSAFQVKTSKNIFTCFSCRKTGNPIEFIRYFKDLPKNQAIVYLSENYTDLPKFEPQPEIKTDLSKQVYAIKKNSIKPASEYLKSRSIDIVNLPNNSYYYDYSHKAVAFICSEKTLINKRIFAPEKGKPKVRQAKGSKLTNALYDATYNVNKGTVFLVESVINAFSLFPYSSLAIFSTMNKFNDVKKLSKYLKGKKVVLAFDNDVKKDKVNAGKECANFYANFILDNIEIKSLSSLQMPENIDINDLLQENRLQDFIKDTDNYKFISIDILNKPLLQNSKEQTKDYKKNSFYVKNSQYFIKKYSNGHEHPKFISDCVYEILYRLNDEPGTRLIKVQQMEINGNSKQRRELFEVASDELTKEKFKKVLNVKGFSFLGTQPDLDNIMMYNMHREKQAEIIKTYGWQTESKMFVFSDCAINSNNLLINSNSIGMITDDKTNKLYYVPATSPANKDDKDIQNFKSEFNYKAGSLDFKKFAKLFYLSNKLNGSVGTQFYLLSLFRDVVVKHLDFFPYLFLYGTAGGGKTSYAEILTGLFGDSSKGVDLKNVTQAGLSRVASQKRNTITYYKEYKTDALPFVEQYFKAGYDCVSRTISAGGTSTKTITFSIESSGLLDSNFLPTNEEAVFSRMIILDFEKAKFTEIQKNAFFELKDHKEQGLAQITKEVLKHRELFESNFKDVYYTVLDELKNGKMKDFKDRERAFKHVALILTPYHILNNVLKFPYDIETLENIMVAHAEAQYEKLNEFKSTSVFWQALAYWKSEGKLREFGNMYSKDKAHFIKKNVAETTGTIFLKSTRLPDLHVLYVSYCKSKNMPFDSLSELKSKLLTEGYEPYISNPNTKVKYINNYHLGSSYAFEFFINKKDGNIIIDGLEFDL